MLSKLQEFFSQKLHNEEKPLEQRLQLASAALLVELMLTDNQVKAEEERRISQILLQQFDISDQELNTLLTLAHNELKDSSDLYQFTRLINDHFSESEKYQLIVNLWEVAYADNELDKYEEHTIRKIADLIYIRHSDFIKAKHQVLEGHKQ